MDELTSGPDISGLEIPVDAWTQPFWEAAERGELLAPRCGNCHRFRWPPGPFCPNCQSQEVEWLPVGTGRIYSFTIVRRPDQDPPSVRVPALVEFPDAGGVRLLGAIVDTPLSAIAIGAELKTGWSQAVNGKVPVFSIAAKD